MGFFTFNENFSPDTFAVLDERENLIYGTLPAKDNVAVERRQCVFSGHKYTFVCSFGSCPETQSKLFSRAIDTIDRMTNDFYVDKKYYKFSVLYSFLNNLLSNEVKQKLNKNEQDLKNQSTVCVSEKCFLTCVSLIFAFLHRYADDVSQYFEEDLQAIELRFECNSLRRQIPSVVIDICRDIGRAGGLYIDAVQGGNCCIVRTLLRKSEMEFIEFSSDNDQFYYDVVTAVMMFFSAKEQVRF